MKAVILLSIGRHPVSGTARAAHADLSALSLIRRALPDIGVTGVYAGRPANDIMKRYLGHGIDRLVHLPLPDQTDPYPALLAWLRRENPDLLLAGARGESGAAGGFLPFALAAALSRPCLHGATELTLAKGAAQVAVARPKGQRQLLRAALACVITASPLTQRATRYRLADVRRGRIETATVASEHIVSEQTVIERRPYRPPPKRIDCSKAHLDGADRLAAMLQSGGEASGADEKIATPATAEEAAAIFLKHLRNARAIPDPKRRSTNDH